MQRRIFFIWIAALLLLLCACGAQPAAEQPTPAPAPTATPAPTPEPTPFPEPEMAQGGEAYMDGKALASGQLLRDGVTYLRLSEAAEALGAELAHPAGSGDFSFPWRKSEVQLTADSLTARYLDRERQLDAAPLLCGGGEDLLIPAESFCAAAEIGCFYDEEFDTLYCTPAAGAWALPENYAVPVMMYHSVGYAPAEANLILGPESLEEQFQFITENGFTPIWFEDLWHVEDFEKPVILVFDDGYKTMHSYLLPLAEKYQVKAVVAIVEEFTEADNGLHMNEQEVRELAESGLISLQSHGVTHTNMGELLRDEQEMELRDSALWLTRFLKKEPLVFVYPIGGSLPVTQELLVQYYRFGVKMVGETYNTSADPTLVYRYFVERNTPIWGFINWLDYAFADPGLNNYVPMPRR